MKIDLNANEMVVKATDSDLCVSERKKIKGKLILTNQRIYFKSTNGNAGLFDLEIDPKTISDVLFFNTWFFLQNGLNLVLRQGNEIRFLLKQRNTWGKLIAEMS
ncbi:MAG: hypothetical protein EOM06_12130 [Sphingobacteriia bacterium]|nr:hypothetical protein [Sphingobacteriia bacterium]